MVVVSSGCRIEIDIVQVDWEQKLCSMFKWTMLNFQLALAAVVVS